MMSKYIDMAEANQVENTLIAHLEINGAALSTQQQRQFIDGEDD